MYQGRSVVLHQGVVFGDSLHVIRGIHSNYNLIFITVTQISKKKRWGGGGNEKLYLRENIIFHMLTMWTNKCQRLPGNALFKSVQLIILSQVTF